MGEDVPGGEEARHRRGLKFRSRDDHAIELFRDIELHLTDIPHVDRLLLELGRFYNPLLDGPIVDLATRRRILEHLERGDPDEARRLLAERRASYAADEGRG